MKFALTDLLALLSLALVVTGVAQIHTPSAFIVAGLLVFGIAILVEKRTTR